MNEAEYLMKNYGDRGGCYRSRPQAEADNTLRDLHNSSYDTKAEFNQFKNIAKTCLPPSMLSSSSIEYIYVCPAPKIFFKQQMSPSELSSCCFCCFQLLSRLVSAVVLTLETSEVLAVFVFTTKTTQPRPQVFSVNGALTCSGLHF